ncbi:unnamed protein product [Cochlearia groenlandica]
MVALIEVVQDSPRNGYTRGMSIGLDGHIEDFVRLVTTPASLEPMCDICGHGGHEYQNCLFYVPYGFREPICTNCREPGHYYFVCPDPPPPRSHSTYNVARHGSITGQTSAHERHCLCLRCRYSNPWP